MTEDPNFAVVTLRQGLNPIQKCTVNLEIFTKQDLNKIEKVEKDEDDWMSRSD